MNATIELPDTDTATPLDHHLQPYFSQLARVSSIKELEASALYKKIQPEIKRVLNGLVQENLAPTSGYPHSDSIKATAWNIERGKRLPNIIRALEEHPQISHSDLLLLTELDYGMARTENRFVAREIAESLAMNYAFAPCYLSLVKGSGAEVRVAGENTQALHGNALFSRYPLHKAHSLALPNGKDKMRGKEKRLGCQQAVIADVDHPLGMLRAVSLHLDAHSTQKHRHRQMKLVLDHLETLRPSLPVLIGGDWNTSGYNSKHAFFTIAGFWRRVMMGVGHVITNHYLRPERWFERRLFRELEKSGFNYRDLNEMGKGTLHYDVKDIEVHENLAEWVPTWCFRFLHWALREHDGRASLKLDWFAGSNIVPVAEDGPAVVADLSDSEGPLSDHDAIVLRFLPCIITKLEQNSQME